MSEMKLRSNRWKFTTLHTGISVLALALSVSVNVAAQAPKAAETKGSVDVKTTPRTPDGHPDFNGFWNTVSAGQFAQRAPEGSILYEFSVNFDETISVCTDDSCQLPNQPPYKPE